LNNHYDSDGALSVFACLEQEVAIQYAPLLKEGAEAGDFCKWSSNNGVKQNFLIEWFLTHDKEAAYQSVLKELPSMFEDFTNTGGKSYQNCWQDNFQAALDDWKAIQDGKAVLKQGPGKIVLVMEPTGCHLSPYALHQGLFESGLNNGTD
jgi:hypothetical protein